MRKLFFILILLAAAYSSKASIDTVTIYSNSMFKDVKCVVVTPSNYTTTAERWPVVYLLHGYSGSYANWARKDTALQALADENRFLVVCPDGGYGSWYFDSPVDLTQRYETHIATEVPAFIDLHYRTIALAKGRAIMGLSMGGHGALFLAARHPDVFGAATSMSGGLDINSLKGKFDLPKVLGDTMVNRTYYTNWSVINLVPSFAPNKTAVLIDCGVDDMFYDMNKRTHERLLQLKIQHTYIERPGGHSWAYWINALPYHFLFARNFFDTH